MKYIAIVLAIVGVGLLASINNQSETMPKRSLQAKDVINANVPKSTIPFDYSSAGLTIQSAPAGAYCWLEQSNK